MQVLSGRWLFNILALGGAAVYAASRSKRSRASVRVVSVTGNGEVECAPDFAQLRLGVRTRDKVAKSASDGLQRRVSALLEALKTQGKIESADLQTTHLSIRQDRHKPEGKEEYIVDYVAYCEVSVKVRDLDALGMVLDVANETGIDELEDLQFDVHDAKRHKQKALELAVKDARAQAEVLARSSGMRLGAVLRITDGPDYDMQRSGGMLSAPMSYGSAIATGTIAVQAQALLKFELQPLNSELSL